MILFLLACPAPTLDDTDSASDPSTGIWPVPSLSECVDPFGTDCIERAVWEDGCEVDPAPVLRDDVVYEGPLGGYEQAPVEFVTSESAWTALLDGEDASRSVDFATEQVVVVNHVISSTCGARITQHGLGADGSVRVSIEDSSGACESVCDMYFTTGVAYAVPRDTTPIVCVAVVNTCHP